MKVLFHNLLDQQPVLLSKAVDLSSPALAPLNQISLNIAVSQIMELIWQEKKSFSFQPPDVDEQLRLTTVPLQKERGKMI